MGFFNLKKILCLLLLFTLCGCSVTYEVEIKDDKVFEKGILIENKKELDNTLNNGMTFEEEIDFTLESMHDIKNGQEEEKTRSFILEKINNVNEIGLKYEHSFESDKYIESPILKQCYDDVNISVDDSYININTSNEFNCFKYYKHLDQVTVVLTTDYKVLKSNYNERKDNKYYWYIEKNNSNTGINISINKNDNTILDDLTDEKKRENWDFVNYIFILIGVLCVIGGFVVFIKVKRSNK